jgi:hypothetical protein
VKTAERSSTASACFRRTLRSAQPKSYAITRQPGEIQPTFSEALRWLLRVIPFLLRLLEETLECSLQVSLTALLALHSFLSSWAMGWIKDSRRRSASFKALCREEVFSWEMLLVIRHRLCKYSQPQFLTPFNLTFPSIKAVGLSNSSTRWRATLVTRMELTSAIHNSFKDLWRTSSQPYRSECH